MQYPTGEGVGDRYLHRADHSSEFSGGRRLFFIKIASMKVNVIK